MPTTNREGYCKHSTTTRKKAAPAPWIGVAVAQSDRNAREWRGPGCVFLVNSIVFTQNADKKSRRLLQTLNNNIEKSSAGAEDRYRFRAK